ncbi:MAG: hypothetical protein ACREF3_15465 [Acetobacteraceae bacterium]
MFMILLISLAALVLASTLGAVLAPPGREPMSNGPDALFGTV